MIPSEDLWQPWTPQEAARHLSGCPADWYVAGGWGLDLWHGRQTRDHADLEICVRMDDLDQTLAHLGGLTFYAAQKGQLWPMDQARDAAQFWGFDPVAQSWRIDVMTERGTADTWIYKRDPCLRVAREKAVFSTQDGIQCLAPALILLFKAKRVWEKDQKDFDMALPRLSQDEKSWLSGAIAGGLPDHPWLSYL